jgi:hypothetical protein
MISTTSLRGWWLLLLLLVLLHKLLILHPLPFDLVLCLLSFLALSLLELLSIPLKLLFKFPLQLRLDPLLFLKTRLPLFDLLLEHLLEVLLFLLLSLVLSLRDLGEAIHGARDGGPGVLEGLLEAAAALSLPIWIDEALTHHSRVLLMALSA